MSVGRPATLGVPGKGGLALGLPMEAYVPSMTALGERSFDCCICTLVAYRKGLEEVLCDGLLMVRDSDVLKLRT